MSPNFLSTYSIWISIHWVRTVGRLWPLADLCFVQAVFCGVPMSAKRPQQGEALCNDAEREALSPVAWYLLSAFQIISERRWKGGFVTRGVIPPFRSFQISHMIPAKKKYTLTSGMIWNDPVRSVMKGIGSTSYQSYQLTLSSFAGKRTRRGPKWRQDVRFEGVQTCTKTVQQCSKPLLVADLGDYISQYIDYLVGGLEHLFFFHILGIIIRTDIFSEGLKPPISYNNLIGESQLSWCPSCISTSVQMAAIRRRWERSRRTGNATSE